MTPLSPNWISIVAGILLSSSIFCVLGLLLSWTLKNRAPAMRVLVLRASLIGVAFSALLCVGVSGRVRPLWNWPAPISSSAQETNEPLVSKTAPPISSPKIASPKFGHEPSSQHTSMQSKPIAATHAKSTAPEIAVGKIAAALWMLGVLPALAWMLTCHFSLASLRRRALDIGSTPAADEMRHLAQNLQIRAPRLLQSESVQGPLLCGLWRPAIVLPSDYQTQFDAPTLRAVLLHELIHLQRRDLWWNATAHLLCALLWPQVFCGLSRAVWKP